MADYIKTESDSIFLPRKGSISSNYALNEHGSVTLSWTNSLTGVTLPNWRKLRAAGKSATTPMQAEEIKIINIPSTYKSWGSVILNNTQPVNQRYMSASWSLYQGLPLISVNNAIDAKALNMAQTKWNAKIFEVMTAFQGGVFLGELRETLHLMTKPGQGIRKALAEFIRAFKKNRGLRKDLLLKAASEQWLEFFFGVLPLLNDVRDASKYLDDHKERLSRELVRVAGSSGDIWDTPVRTHQQHSTYALIEWDVYTKRGASARYSGAISSVAGSTTTKVLDALGFTPRNWAPTLYNLLPWSFVLDYFSNLGTIIEAWSNQFLSLAWGSLTTKQLSETTTSSFVAKAPSFPTIWLLESNPGYYLGQRKRVFRSVVTTIPVPGLSYKIPGFSTKWINLAALLAARSNMANFR